MAKSIIYRLTFLILVAVAVCNISTSVFAAESGPIENVDGDEFMSELNILDSLDQKSDKELICDGYSKEEIADIRDYKEIVTHKFEELSKLDDTTLSKMGYTNEQVQILNHFTGSNAQIKALAGKMKFSCNTTSFTYDSSKKTTNARVQVEFNWTSPPAFKLVDIIGIAWNGPMNKKKWYCNIKICACTGPQPVLF